VRAAMRYWNGNVTEYTPYNVTLVLNGSEERADVVVRFVETIPTNTSNRSDLLGLAPLNEPGVVVTGTQTIYIAEGYNTTSTVQVLKHEFGHYLGLDHDDRPQPLMSPTYSASSTLRPNAPMRLLAWQNHTLAVSMEVYGMENERAVRSQIQHALGYYERGAEGWLGTNVTFRLVNESDVADIRIEVAKHTTRTDLLEDHGSIAKVYGMDPDGDGALEYFTNATIVVGGVETEAVGWHVGYWLAYALRGQVGTDVPEAFDDPTDSRRDDWWE
ncbi:MAG: matrixin family metalloprotease, partial [Halodesulfurarchaeum sp.]